MVWGQATNLHELHYERLGGLSVYLIYTPWNSHFSPLKMVVSNTNLLFQGSRIFRGELLALATSRNAFFFHKFLFPGIAFHSQRLISIGGGVSVFDDFYTPRKRTNVPLQEGDELSIGNASEPTIDDAAT